MLIWHIAKCSTCQIIPWESDFEAFPFSVYMVVKKRPSFMWVADKIACYPQYPQWTWPKWVVPYRLWMFTHKFEHPKSTPHYFSLPLILFSKFVPPKIHRLMCLLWYGAYLGPISGAVSHPQLSSARQPNPSWLRNSWPAVDLLQGNSGHPQWNFPGFPPSKWPSFNRSVMHPPNDVHFERKLLRYIKYVGFEFSIVFPLHILH